MAKLIVNITEIPCPCGRPSCGVVPHIETEYDPEDQPSPGLSLLGQILPRVLASMGTLILNNAREEQQAQAQRQAADDQVEWPKELTVLPIPE